MKEFIVWDKDNKMFYPPSSIWKLNLSAWDNMKELRIFQHIGKSDINNNKIYANCSVVEFMHKGKWLYLNGITGESKHEDIKMKGYFQFHEDKLRYELIILDWDKKKSESIFSVLPYNMETIANLKIIDTIQETN